jgi:hypothetical protein
MISGSSSASLLLSEPSSSTDNLLAWLFKDFDFWVGSDFGVCVKFPFVLRFPAELRATDLELSDRCLDCGALEAIFCFLSELFGGVSSFLFFAVDDASREGGGPCFCMRLLKPDLGAIFYSCRMRTNHEHAMPKKLQHVVPARKARGGNLPREILAWRSRGTSSTGINAMENTCTCMS